MRTFADPKGKPDSGVSAPLLDKGESPSKGTVPQSRANGHVKRDTTPAKEDNSFESDLSDEEATPTAPLNKGKPANGAKPESLEDYDKSKNPFFID